jgi:ABC-type siderophore export system fused ATPase/permease subunit
VLSGELPGSAATMKYEGVSKISQTGRLERELHMVQLSATRCSYIAILWASLVSFTAIILCVASQRVFIVAVVVVVVVVHFVIYSVRKLFNGKKRALQSSSYRQTYPENTSKVISLYRKPAMHNSYV